ncbi:MAG: DUF1997 domain-containing protein [Synechococcales cyanobacterium RU_4_20]|nr:DUF1997 domain-containing protein [Synechococcales cyanobacterium RU_4_20]NJR67633.1 DUF1997 domain-containing protein [Synechococcales cyanobacterium CRU_2_2]
MSISSTSQFPLENQPTSRNPSHYVDNGFVDPTGAASARLGVEQIVGNDEGKPLTEFRSRFTDCMEMCADTQQVADYLDNHQDWFRRCAAPMEAKPLGNTGYALSLGSFGALGYAIAPQIGLDLLPQEDRVYRIRTIDVPGYESVGYSVDFQAVLELRAVETTEAEVAAMTHVEWVLDLGVTLQFPRFIQILPQQMIQSTGDRLLRQVVRQISRRLTLKVKEDFHGTFGLPMPK